MVREMTKDHLERLLEEQPLITPLEIARHFRVSTQTVYKKLRDHELELAPRQERSAAIKQQRRVYLTQGVKLS